MKKHIIALYKDNNVYFYHIPKLSPCPSRNNINSLVYILILQLKNVTTRFSLAVTETKHYSSGILLKKNCKNCMPFQREIPLKLKVPKNLRNIAALKSKMNQRSEPEVRKGYTYSLFLLLMHGW